MKTVRRILMAVIAMICIIPVFPQSGSGNLYTLWMGEKYGYINEAGRLVLPAKYARAEDFAEGIGLVEEEIRGKWKYINSDGDVLFGKGFDAGKSFSEGYAAVRIDGKWGFIDTNGTVVIPIQYDRAESYSEGYAVVRNRYDEGAFYIDKKGQEVFPGKRFQVCGSFHEGYAVVGKKLYEDKWEDVDKNGFTRKTMISGTRSGVINFRGEYIIPYKYMYCDSKVLNGYWIVSDGRVTAERYSIYGFVNMKDEIVIDIVYRHLGAYVDGVIPFSRGGEKYGLMNGKGEVIVEEIYDEIQDFKEGVGVYVENGKYGYLNPNGSKYIEAKYEFAKSFENGMALVRCDGVDGYITKTGKLYLATDYGQ